MSELTDKQYRFVDEYLVDLNATQAAIRAGYSENTAGSIGSELLDKPHVAAMVERRQKARQRRVEANQDYVIAKIHETIERCSQATPVTDGEGKPVLIKTSTGELAPAYMFVPNAVLQGCNLLMDHHGMKKTRVEHSGPGGVPLAPPSIAISFPNGGPGTPAEPEGEGVETSG